VNSSPATADDGAVVRVVAAQSLLGTLGVFVLESGVSAEAAVFWRCLFGAAFLALFCALAGQFRSAFWTRRTLGLAVTGGVCLAVNWMLFFKAIQITTIGFATVAYHVQPFWVLLASIAVARERVSALQVGWLLLAFFGFLLALDARRVVFSEGEARLLAGAGLAIAGSLFYTATLFATRAIGADLRPQLVALVHCATGAAMLAPVLLLFGGILPSAVEVPWLLGLGALHTGLVYVLLYSALPRLQGAMIAVLLFVYPAAALLVDYLVYGHSLAMPQVAGLLLIACGTLGMGGAWPRRWRRPAGLPGGGLPGASG